MQLAILTAVLAAIASAESGGGPVVGLAWRLLVVATATLVAPLAALIGSQQLAGTIRCDDRSEDSISRLQALIIGLWLLMVGVILLVAQWPRIVRENWQLADWPLVDELAILLPVIAPLILVWAALYRLERAAQKAACLERQVLLPPPRLLDHLWMNVRHQLALVMLPPLAAVGCLELVRSHRIPAIDLDVTWWFALPLVGMMLLLMPVAVRRIWRTTPLSGPLRPMLDGLCGGTSCRVREILIWHTDGTMANAAVVGFSPWLRYLLLTDVLLARLSDEQIAAVVRHELTHLRRWHLPLRLALLLLPVAWWMAIERAWPGGAAAVESICNAIGMRVQMAGAFAVPLGLLAYSVIVVGWYSRLLEHDADLGASISDEGQFNPALADGFCSALTTLCGRGRESWFSQWLHPPVLERLDFLRQVAADPPQAAAFRRKLAVIAISMALLYAAAAALVMA